MTDPDDDDRPSLGLWHAVAGVAVFTIGGLFFANLQDNPDDGA